MADLSIEDRIDRLFKEHWPNSKEEIRAFIERLHSSYEAGESTAWKGFRLLILLWAAAVAISTGLVNDGDLGPLKPASIQATLIFFPLLFGAVAYWSCGGLAASSVMWAALRQCYQHTLPQVRAMELEDCLSSPNPAVFERLLPLAAYKGSDAKAAGLFDRVWQQVWALIGGFVTLGGFVHVSLLVWQARLWSVVAIGVSVVVGLALLMRGIYMLATLTDVTKRYS